MSADVDMDRVARVRKLVQENTRCSEMLATSACRTFHRRLWRAIHESRQSRWDSLVASANRDLGEGLMYLYIYMSDGCSCWMIDKVPFQTMHDKIRKREFRYKAEWLMEKSILKRLPVLGDFQIAMRSHTPRLLMEKSAWHIMQASVLAQPMLRVQRPQGIVISVYLQDGLHFRNFQSKQAARRSVFYDKYFRLG